MNRSSRFASLLGPIMMVLATPALTMLIASETGCGIVGPDVPETPSGAGKLEGDGGPGRSLPPSVPLAQSCNKIAKNAEQVLKDNCTRCHGANSQGKGNFASVLDVGDLLASKRVTPGDLEKSPLYQRMVGDTMPPAGESQQPSSNDINQVRDWILCKAPDWNSLAPTAEYVSVDARLSYMRNDLRSFAKPSDRIRMRYIDLSTLGNAGLTEVQLNVYREGVSLVLNSLSYGTEVVKPTAIDPDKLIYRLDLRDYGWDAATWNLFSKDYPYLVRYNQDSRLFPYDENSAEEIRRQTATDAPYLQADWLIAHASQSQRYYELLGLAGKTLYGVAADLGIDIFANIDDEQVDRAGFAESGVTVSNRMIERHEIPGAQGSMWVTYDFADNEGASNIHANPLDFVQDGGEAIFNLPNGLQAYLIVDAVGNLLDKVPNFIATDPNSRTREIGIAASCMGCHAQNGIIARADTVREFVLTTGVDPTEREDVLALYLPANQMQSLIRADQDRYKSAREQANVVAMDFGSMSRMVNTHQGPLALSMVAAVLSVPIGELEAALDASPGAFPPEILNLRTQDGSIERRTLDLLFDDLLFALGLGESISL